MKKTALLLVGAIMATAAFGALAADQGVTYDGKNIAIVKVEVGPSSDGRKFHVSDFQNGVYVHAAKYFAGKQYPNAEKMIRQRFAELGFKVVDNPIGADMQISFDASGSMDMDNADAQAAHSNMPSNSNIFGGISAGITAGIPGVLAFASGGLFQSDSQTGLMALVMLKPVKTKGFFGREGMDSSVKNGNFTNNVLVKYKLDKKNPATEDLVLKMLVDQWIKMYVVADAPVAGAAPSKTSVPVAGAAPASAPAKTAAK